jgi:hypothetical protein
MLYCRFRNCVLLHLVTSDLPLSKTVRVLFILLIPIVTLGQRLDYDTTFTSNGQKFKVQRFQLEKYMTQLKVTKGKDVILIDTSEFSAELYLLDFNGDDGIDIMVNFMGNIDRQSLFLFDKGRNVFKKIQDFEKYPEAKPIKGLNFYYSYHRSGCADNYWTSDLFTIVDFKVVHLGKIFGNGCEEPRNIKIYRIGRGQEDIAATLSYRLATDHKNGKWGFIEDYWTTNYRVFK